MSAPWIAAFAALWFVVLLLGFAVIGVMRRITGVLERAEQRLAAEPGGVPLLTVIPPFELLDDDTGASVSSEEIIREPTILLFMEAGCTPCRQLAEELQDGPWKVGIPLVIVAGERGLGAGFDLPRGVPVLRQRGREVAQLFQSATTPHAFVIDQAGVVLDRGVPGSVADIELLARRQRDGVQGLERVAGG